MQTNAPNTVAASSLQARKIKRKELALYCGLSLRYIDELTRKGVLPYYKIGKSIRYDLAEIENALHERFHVRAKARTASRILTA